MNRHIDPDKLLEDARALRHEALAGMLREAAIKCRTLVAHLTEKASAPPAPHAPHPRQVAAPTHS